MKTIKPIHPFPARMAPELAIASLERLDKGSKVLDPMMGSGTVIRHAVDQGHRAYGCDLDPLAVLISKVWASRTDDKVINELGTKIIERARTVRMRDVSLPFIDNDAETRKFVKFWFANPQRNALRRISFAINSHNRAEVSVDQLRALEVLKVALSRIIITKENGASLARDVSHSRPHKVAETTDFDVFEAYQRSLKSLLKRLATQSVSRDCFVRQGDARDLSAWRRGSFDAVITSPPYLNAIDYMRGHRLALVWLGYSLSELRQIRTTSVGAERYTDNENEDLDDIVEAMIGDTDVPEATLGMMQRYASDSFRIMCEVSRVLTSGGRATVVIGNSCLHGVYIDNARGVKRAALAAGLKFKSQAVRELPPNSRYLPIAHGSGTALAKRMRKEVVLEFVR